MEQLTRDIVQWLEEKIEIENKRHDMKVFMIDNIPIVEDASIDIRRIHISLPEALFDNITLYLGVIPMSNNECSEKYRHRWFELDGFEIIALFDKEVGKC